MGPVVFVCGSEERAEFGRGEFDGVNGGEKAAVEVIHAGVTASAGRFGFVHLAEQAANEVVGACASATFVEEAGEEILGKQTDVLGEHGDHALEDETAGAGRSEEHT